jgi:hypothetical protein
MVLSSWLLLTLVLVSGSFLSEGIPSLSLTHDNLVWLTFASFTLLIGELFSRVRANQYNVFELDKVVILTTHAMVSIIISGVLFSSVVSARVNGFDGENLIWIFSILVPFAYIIRKYLPLAFAGFHFLNAKLIDHRLAQQEQAHDAWMHTESLKFDEWERQHSEGVLPASFDDLR